MSTHYCTANPCPLCGATFGFWQYTAIGTEWNGNGTNTSVATPWWAVPDSTKAIISSATNGVVYSASTGTPTLAPVYWTFDQAANVIRYYAGIDFGSTVPIATVCSTESTSTVMWTYTTGTGNSTTQYNWTPAASETKEEAPAPKLRSFRGSVAGKVKISE